MELAGRPFTSEMRKTAKIEATGSLAEGFFGITAAILAIIALFGVAPLILAAIATIAIGAAFFLHGGAMGARYNRLAVFTTENKYQINELGGSISVEMLGGITGIVLGIIALFGVAPLTLIASAVIVFGVSLILGTGAIERLNQLVSAVWNDESARRIANNASQTIMSLHLLIGFAAVVLGVLAVIGISPVTLSLVALLSLGAADFLTGSTMAARMTGMFR